MKNSKRTLSKSQDTRKIRKILNEEVRLGINTNSDSEKEDVDLTTELYPLSHYINKREEMIEHMFTIIKGAKLKKMLPPILKDLPLDELKADCLIHLLGMSKKRIHAILEGKEINSSSDSETHSDSSASPSKMSKIVQPIIIKQEGCSDISDNSEEVVLVDPDVELLDVTASYKNRKEGKLGKNSKSCQNIHQKNKSKQDQIKNSNQRKEQVNVKQFKMEENDESEHETISGSETNNVEAPKEGKTLLEILELEMRARAIRALLQKSDATPEHEQNSTESSKKTPTELKKLSEGGGEKVNPIRNFRKNKQKNDDVIVIAPKVVTIDLTDETDSSNVKTKTVNTNQKNLDLDNILDNIQDSVVKESEKTSQIINIVDEMSTLSQTKNVFGSKNELNSRSEPVRNNSNTCKIAEQPKSNWAQRWLESKEVKKVVSTSKIYGNVRKKIKRARLAKQSQENSPNLATESQEIQGSVGEYELLSKSIKSSNTNIEILESNPEASTSLITVEDDTEKTKETGLKECTNSVEQVQDVTSTKSETRPENSVKKHAVNDPKIVDNIDVDLKSVRKESHISDAVVFETSTSKLNINSKDEMSTPEAYRSNTVNTKSKLLNLDISNLETQTSMSQSIGEDDVLIEKSSVDKVKISVSKAEPSKPENSKNSTSKIEVWECEKNIENDNKSNIYESESANTKAELLKTDLNETILKTNIDESQQNATNAVAVNKIVQPKSSPVTFHISKPNKVNKNSKKTIHITPCDTKIIPSKTEDKTTQMQELNEVETLEINLTDEDREIM